MKLCYLLLLAAALNGPSAGAQGLRGGFCNTFFIGSDSYWFGKVHFKEVSTGCVGYSFGSGTYRLTGNRLVLQFDRSTFRLRGGNEPAAPEAAAPLVVDSSAATQEFVVPITLADTPTKDSSLAITPAKDSAFVYRFSPAKGFSSITFANPPNTGTTHKHCRHVLYLKRRTRTTFYIGKSRYQRMTLAETKALLAQYERCRRGGQPY